jgi:ATP-dependent DNA helicase PIF1
MPSSLRRLFATILVFYKPKNVAGLWTKHFDAMAEDFKHKNPNPHWVEQMVLIDIRNILQSMKSKDNDKDINKFPLPKIDDAFDDAIAVPREIFEEVSIKTNPEDVGLSYLLNEEQRAAYDEIMSTIDSKRGGLFFVDGPGSTGKTFLYRALLGNVRSQNKLAVATATSGVVASIMPGGRTAHSRFKIPLTLDDKQGCDFTKQCGTAKLLQQASLIIWDEASMTKRQAVKALDYSMCDIMGRKDLPFGGKTVVFGGDFRQVLPVVRKGSRAQIVGASLRKSYLWEFMRHLKLVCNMRAQTDPWLVDYMLRIGNGTEEVNEDGDVRIPNEICVPHTGDSEKDLDTLIESIFPNLNENMANKDYITSRAILSTSSKVGRWCTIVSTKRLMIPTTTILRSSLTH